MLTDLRQPLHLSSAYIIRARHSRPPTTNQWGQLDVGLAPQDWETIWEHLRTHTALSLTSVHITKSGDILDVLLDLQYLQVQGEEFSYIAAKRA